MGTPRLCVMDEARMGKFSWVDTGSFKIAAAGCACKPASKQVATFWFHRSPNILRAQPQLSRKLRCLGRPHRPPYIFDSVMAGAVCVALSQH